MATATTHTHTHTKSSKRLYAVPDEYKKVVYQPNHITNAEYNYTLIQERIFNYIIFHLQTYMNKVMNGTIITQLEIFGEQQKDYVDIEIPLSLIGKPYQYPDIRQRAIEMMSITVAVNMQSYKTKEKIQRMQSMLTHVDIPVKEEKRRSGTLPIRISKVVAMMILNIERNNGTPICYTSFLLNIALQAQNKYTSRIYKLLSSYKRPAGGEPGMYIVSYEKFRSILQIGNKYRDYEAFKRCVIMPVYDELKEHGDIYFELSETRDPNKKVTKLNFVIKWPADVDTNLTECKLWSSIEKRLVEWFECDQAGVTTIITKLKDKKLSARTVLEKVNWFVVYYLDHLHDEKRVRNKSAFVIGGLKREFL